MNIKHLLLKRLVAAIKEARAGCGLKYWPREFFEIFAHGMNIYGIPSIVM